MDLATGKNVLVQYYNMILVTFSKRYDVGPHQNLCLRKAYYFRYLWKKMQWFINVLLYLNLAMHDYFYS